MNFAEKTSLMKPGWYVASQAFKSAVFDLCQSVQIHVHQPWYETVSYQKRCTTV